MVDVGGCRIVYGRRPVAEETCPREGLSPVNGVRRLTNQKTSSLQDYRIARFEDYKITKDTTLQALHG